jgi:ArsR family transcriptional regulator, arsenate/arsenite/antimonite-responsive transcriptional repressor
MDRSKVLASLSALAHDARLDVMRLLVVAGDAGMPAGKIGDELGHSASRLSFHLGILEQAGLIRSRRVARNIIYSADFTGLGGTISYLLRDCCMDHPEVHACCSKPQRAAIPTLLE